MLKIRFQRAAGKSSKGRKFISTSFVRPDCGRSQELTLMKTQCANEAHFISDELHHDVAGPAETKSINAKILFLFF